MLSTTMGQLLLNNALPEGLQQPRHVLDKQGITALLGQLAERHPDQYRATLKRLMDVGRESSYLTGGNSFGAKHLRPGVATLAARYRIRQAQQQIFSDDTIPDEEKSQWLMQVVAAERQKMIPSLYKESLDEGNPLAQQVLSGARGNVTNLSSLRGFDGAYEDHHGETVPIPILKNYSEGLSPAEYWAGTSGARKGVTDVKLGVAKAGYYSKQLTQLAHRLLVSQIDDDEDPNNDKRLGMPSPIDDRDNEGSLLAVDHGPFKRNTVLTPKIIQAMKQKGFDELLLRSPIAGGPRDGGVYARDAGMRERGGLPPLGDYIGIAAAQSIGEKLTQAGLCLAEGTRVRMADGSDKAIELVEAGEFVLGADANRMTFPVRVANRFDNGNRVCVRTVFSPAHSRGDTDKLELLASPDHKVFCSRCVSGQKEEALNFVPRLLPIGTKSHRFYAHPAAGTQDRPDWRREPYAKLIGLLSGDGCYTKSVHGVHLSCYDPTLIEDVSPYLASLNLRATKLKGHKGYYRISQVVELPSQRDAATGRILPGSRNPARRCLEDRGMMHKYAHEKLLPPDIDGWDNDSVLNYLAGLFATDGSWYMPKNRSQEGAMYFALAMTAKPIIAGVKRLLSLRFGIYPGPLHTSYKNAAAVGGMRKNPLHKFVIAQGGQVRQLTRLIIDRLVGIKRFEAEAALRFTAACHDEFRLVRRHQESVGQLQTFDLEVDHPDHMFVLANGLIVSNSSKHSGGVAGAGPSGYDLLNQLVQTPENFQGGATHAQLDGHITDITDAPQGGQMLLIGGVQHYIPPGRKLSVQPGTEVEAGDTLTDGLPNPAEIVQHKGIGEGRRYFVQQFRRAAEESGVRSHRRNLELISRGLIDHVEVTDPWEDYAPGDVIPYREVAARWQARDGSTILTPTKAVGRYLERPVLHYSIGTQIKPSMLPKMKKFNVGGVEVHDEPPPFQPRMQRAAASISTDSDWMTRMLGSGQKGNLLDSVHRGGISDTAGTSYVPALVEGLNFGKLGPTQGR